MVSQLEGLMYLSDVNRKRYLLEQVRLKRMIERELKKDLDPVKELEYENALKIVQNNIQKMRVAGLM